MSSGFTRRTIWLVAVTLMLLGGMQGCASTTPTQRLRTLLSSNDADGADKLINDGADVNDVDQDGVTPLHLAAMGGHKKAVGQLLAKGANVNAQTKSGHTPLYDAVSNGHEKAVAILLANNADPNLTPPGEKTPLAVAQSKNFVGITVMLKAHGAH